MTGGLHEATIKSGGTAPAGYLHIGPVKREASVLVDVESVVQHSANEASRLADSKDQDFARYRRAFKWVVAEVGEKIANAGESCAGHIGVFYDVNKFVES